MHTDTEPRPSNACVLHLAPTEGRPWALASEGYSTCVGCLGRLRENLTDIATRYDALDATPGAISDGTRGAPGFASKPSASPHIVTMTDWRSKCGPVARDAVEYVWDPTVTYPLPRGVQGPLEAPGGYVQKRDVWYGSDGKAHTEQGRPPRSIAHALAALADLVAELREVKHPTTRQVAELVPWLDRHLDWITRQDWVTDVDEQVRELLAQLKPVTGDPAPAKIGKCPNVLYRGEPTETVCGQQLYAPAEGATSDTIRCANPDCRRPWPRSEWLHLGNLMAAS